MESPADPDALYRPFLPFSSWRDARINSALWDRYVERLQERREAADADAHKLTVRRSLVAAALNTGAIEGLHRAGRGLTMTVVEHALDWEKHVRDAEGPMAEAYVRAGLEAFDMALDLATKRTPEVGEAWVRRLHAVACAPQETVQVHARVGDDVIEQRQPLAHGSYKTAPNHVLLPDGSVHPYCPVGEVPVEMHRLVEELKSQEFQGAHPILQAAFAHHTLAYVHPFQDGNGRVARAFASVFLLRAASIPLLVYDDQQADYFAALAAADDGRQQALIDFIQDRALDLMAVAADLLGVPEGTKYRPSVIRPADRMPPAQVVAAHRLEEVLDREFRIAVNAVETGKGITIEYTTMGYTLGARDPDGRRTVSDTFPYAVIKAEEFGINVGRWLPVFVSELGDAPLQLAVRVNAGDDVAEFRVQDVYPEVKAIAEQRVRAFVRRVVHELVGEAQAELNWR